MEFTSLENVPFEELFEPPKNWRQVRVQALRNGGFSVHTDIAAGGPTVENIPWISGTLMAVIHNNNTGKVLLRISCGPDDFLQIKEMNLREEKDFHGWHYSKDQECNSLEELVDAWFQFAKFIESSFIFGLWRKELSVAKRNEEKILSKQQEERLEPVEGSFYISKRAKDGNYIEKRKEESGNITYVYDEKHIKARNKKKAQRLTKLAKGLKKMRSQVKKDITNEDDRTRLAALAVAIIDETFERVGNRYSAADMKHYGVTTFLVKHIKFSGSTAKIRYVGKSGIKQNKTVKTAKVVSALKKLCSGKKPSALVFELDDFTLTDNNVNQYLRPFDITAKDIRGLHANDEVRKQLQKMKKGKDEKERKATFKEAVEEAAKIVGHKPSTLKNQYLIPGFEEKYIGKGEIIGPKVAHKQFVISKRAKSLLQVEYPYNNCFFYSAVLALLNPELTLIRGKHSEQNDGDTAHFWVKDKEGHDIDLTSSQYRKGKLLDGEPVDVFKNIDFVVEDPMFKTLPEKIQQKISSLAVKYGFI